MKETKKELKSMQSYPNLSIYLIILVSWKEMLTWNSFGNEGGNLQAKYLEIINKIEEFEQDDCSNTQT